MCYLKSCVLAMVISDWNKMLFDSSSNCFEYQNNLSCYVRIDERGDEVPVSKRPHSEVLVPMA